VVNYSKGKSHLLVTFLVTLIRAFWFGLTGVCVCGGGFGGKSSTSAPLATGLQRQNTWHKTILCHQTFLLIVLGDR